ncbi:MAG: helix-turn-helix transcriptional regulator, partial [Eggerthellaceae bacterium]|nr:helix-turn-helix transcriptional regulator [Eggerthellaceae bacterium]
GIILAWLHLEEEFVASLAATVPGINIMGNNGIWLYGGMFLGFAGCAAMRRHALKLLDWRGTRAFIFTLCLAGTAVIILGAPSVAGLLQSGGATGTWPRVLFAVGVTMLGIVAALTLTQCARQYLPLEPGEVLFFSFMAQLLMFVLYNIFNSYGQYVAWEGGPAYVNLLGLCLLPLLAWYFMAQPKGATRGAGQPVGATAEHEGAADTETADEPRSALRDRLLLPFSQRAKLSPSFWLLLLTIFIINGTMFFIMNALLAAQPSAFHLFDTQLGMLLRFVLVLVLIVACFTVAKPLPLEKLFWAAFALIPILPALLMLVGISAKVQVLVAVGAMFLLDFVFWIILILTAQTKGKNALLLFVLGQAASCAGILLGTVLGSSAVVGASLAGIRLAAACLMILVVLVTVLLLNEQRIRDLLGGIAKDGLNVRKVLDKPADEAALPPTPRAALWAESCRIVGERSGLSEREQEVLRQLADNRTPQDIAGHLFISLHTVRTHTKNIYAKLDVHSRDELIALVRREYEALK